MPAAIARKISIEDQAFVLRKVEYSDTSLIVHLLTRRHGMVSVLAKGAHREKSPWRGVLDLPALLQIEISLRQETELQLLTGAQLLEPFLGIRRNLQRFYVALYVIELMEEAGRPAGSESLFRLFWDALKSLEDPKADCASILTAFELRLFSDIGLEPALQSCAGCGKAVPDKGNFAFYPGAGGILCTSCKPPSGKKMILPAEVIQKMIALQKNPWDRLPSLQGLPSMRQKIRKALDQFLHYHWERIPKTRPLLSELFS